MTPTRRIALWSGPRNVSTALMYAFANRPDCSVVDEPLFGWFLKHSDAWRPSREEVLATMELDPLKVIRELNGPHPKSLFFMKHMANHLDGLEWEFILEWDNVLLTRHPREVLSSYARHIKNPTLLDTGYELQVRLQAFLREHERQPLVLDSRELLIDPAFILGRLCFHLNVPFDAAMLHWPAGARPEDGVWAKYWYHNLHRSTGFAPYHEKQEPVPDHLKELYRECMGYYEQLSEYSIKVSQDDTL